LKIGIVGNGTVGKAVSYGFSCKGHEVYVNDVKQFENEKTYNKSYLMQVCDLIFICTPTNSCSDGSLNTNEVENAVKQLNDNRQDISEKEKRTPIIIIKSTVVPGTTRKLASRYPELRFAFNPEFLRAAHAQDDFLNQKRIVIGVSADKIAKEVMKAYEGWKCPAIITDFETAEIIKLVANGFLTLKVAYACEVANICRLLGVDADEVMEAVTLDPRIHPSHLVPSKGPIPRDSPCLPKDMSGLVHYLETLGYDCKLLKSAYELGVEKE
jgi:UDPglucose 6-dehydrogenase